MKTCLVKRYNCVRPFHSNGFTFVEMLCAFSLFIILASFLPLCFPIIYHDGFVNERLQKMEWEVFSSQVKKELRMSEKVSVENNRLILIKDNQTIVYEKYGSSIRRRVNYQGHEVMLQNLKMVSFETLPSGFHISIVDYFDQHETVLIRPILSLEANNVP